ncbi:hypothetical protein D8B23_14930 [Verminephrobacter aporrectodeae subsp. tuberculatae]|uniref:Ubiquinone biosynthesis protein UbiJ n=2 Tax=Verminephrobacter TaxID=364316 RepID=A0ABT3KQ95_9BURK|nr:hypothetical protein [Verminephrobacter aporrectodeae]MCW5220536.1 hypothetical protein [Verminephrobacter aporrectodeae subsp. tuberculatae]MCW5255506.1 hypothetical protein [Verminephrobacter aporrectodeae subsp. tuberculatae]MCW5289832.1 hypothetical protein [Verminephrobacter aporrectodeae subsp. tuberculatae]MCW5320490.1 hypothetical protein [Verminephrobacter aporrectodeae subsp. tuberculatae]MCW8199674.1 hypothetical protein [Verminephrobacter aporrectodeae subsp. tuberculatae]
MATPQFPFPFLHSLIERVGRAAAGAQAPQWLVHEAQLRLVLLLNHVLMQEAEAMHRLVRQKGRVAHVQWRAWSLALRVTPAGLFNLAPAGAVPDLRLELIESSAFVLARGALRGARPAIRIEGDVQLAAEINWLVEHLRWDLEEDLARVLGDAPAHVLARCARAAAQALRRFAGAQVPGTFSSSVTMPPEPSAGAAERTGA